MDFANTESNEENEPPSGCSDTDLVSKVDDDSPVVLEEKPIQATQDSAILDNEQVQESESLDALSEEIAEEMNSDFIDSEDDESIEEDLIEAESEMKNENMYLVEQKSEYGEHLKEAVPIDPDYEDEGPSLERADDVVLVAQAKMLEGMGKRCPEGEGVFYKMKSEELLRRAKEKSAKFVFNVYNPGRYER